MTARVASRLVTRGSTIQLGMSQPCTTIPPAVPPKIRVWYNSPEACDEPPPVAQSTGALGTAEGHRTVPPQPAFVQMSYRSVFRPGPRGGILQPEESLKELV